MHRHDIAACVFKQKLELIDLIQTINDQYVGTPLLMMACKRKYEDVAIRLVEKFGVDKCNLDYIDLDGNDVMSIANDPLSVSWHYNDTFFSSFDWTKEPKESLSSLYIKKAEQLRNDYDYLILMYQFYSLY